jgi:hypothetical protein
LNVKNLDGEIILDLTVRTSTKLKPYTATDGLSLLDNSFKIEINKHLSKAKIRISNHAVNVYYLHCTCKAYRESIKKFPKRDIRRICKHLFLAISSNYIDKYDDLTRLMIESKFWYSHRDILKLRLNQEIIYLAFSYEKEIVNLFIRRSDWQIFPFEVDKKEWQKNISGLLSESEIKSIKNFILRYYKAKKNELITQI